MLSDYPEKMPSWVKNSYNFGIVIAIINFNLILMALSCSKELRDARLPYLQYIEYTGIPSAFITGLLIFGAHQRQSSLILVWMIIGTIKSFADIIFGIWFATAVVKLHQPFPFVLFLMEFILYIFFQLVGIFNASKAIKEIGACSVKTTFELGIVIAVLNSLGFFGAALCSDVFWAPPDGLPYYIPYMAYSGLLGAFITGFLIYGTCQRQSFPILVWMIIASIKCFIDILFGIWFVIAVVNLQYYKRSVPFVWWIEIGLTLAKIKFQLVGIFHAYRAKKEIDGTGGYSQFPSEAGKSA